MSETCKKSLKKHFTSKLLNLITKGAAWNYTNFFEVSILSKGLSSV